MPGACLSSLLQHLHAQPELSVPYVASGLSYPGYGRPANSKVSRGLVKACTHHAGSHRVTPAWPRLWRRAPGLRQARWKPGRCILSLPLLCRPQQPTSPRPGHRTQVSSAKISSRRSMRRALHVYYQAFRGHDPFGEGCSSNGTSQAGTHRHRANGEIRVQIYA